MTTHIRASYQPGSLYISSASSAIPGAVIFAAYRLHQLGEAKAAADLLRSADRGLSDDDIFALFQAVEDISLKSLRAYRIDEDAISTIINLFPKE